MQVNSVALARAAAFIAWADSKLEIDELKTIQDIFKKYGIEWKDAKVLVEKEMEALLAGDGSDEEKDEEIIMGVLDFGEVDFPEVLDNLALIAVADKTIDLKEIEILHKIGKAANIDPVLVTASLLKAAQTNSPKLKL